jgi:hypothetical protein
MTFATCAAVLAILDLTDYALWTIPVAAVVTLPMAAFEIWRKRHFRKGQA